MVDNIQSAIDLSVESNVKKEPFINMGSSVLMMLSKAGDLIPSWWSRSRDVELRRFWKQSDHLSGTLNVVTSRISSIAFRVVARDMSIKTHVRIADDMDYELHNYPQYGDGWIKFVSPIIEDLFSTDNGFFAEIIGEGRKDSALTGKPVSIIHLDSSRCQRTNSPLYPVVYLDDDGTQYKLHYTRVLYGSQMPSPIKLMNGVGFCSVSRCINSAQNLIDMSSYKQEKLGSRPTRQLMITKGGLDPDDLARAFRYAEESMNNQGLTRYSKTIVVGDRMLTGAGIDMIPLSSAPDGFDEETSTMLGMGCLALGFGVEMREIFPILSSGGTKTDAIIQHIKQRGKTIGQTIQMLENGFNQKYLPTFLKMEFEFQDNAEERELAEIRNIKAQAREKDIKNLITDIRTEREKMLNSSELTVAQFEQLELNDGRTPDGIDIEILFYSDEKDYKEMLDGISKSNFEEYETKIMLIISTSRSPDLVRKARYALAAVINRYEKPTTEQGNVLDEQGNNIEPTPGKDTTYNNDKFGRSLPRTVTAPQSEINVLQEDL